MNINPAYLLIQGLVETNSLSQNGFQLKGGESPGTSKEGNSYFMLQVPPPLLQGFHEHHLSIFEHLNHQSGGFSHYSIRSVDKVVRIFFDRFGTFFTAHLKATPEGSLIPVTEKQADQYKATATRTCASIVNQLFKLTEERFSEQRAEANQALLSLEKWSKKNSKKKTTNFQNRLRRCAELFKKAGLFCLEIQERSFLYTRARVLQTYSDNIASAGSKKVEPPSPTIEVQAVEVDEKKTLSPRDIEQASPAKPKRDLHVINQELMEISKILDPVERICARYRLLQEKIDNLDDSQFRSIAKCFKELDAVQDEAKRGLYDCLKRGDEKGFQQLLSLGCAPDYDTLFLLVAHGNVKLFKHLYQKQRFSLNVGVFPTEFLFKLRGIPLDRVTHNGAGGFLRTAYENDHFPMFEELMRMGCYPNITHQMSFLYYVIMSLSTKSTQKYAELLIDLGSDPNVGLIDPESFEVGFRSSQGFVGMVPSKKNKAKKSKESLPPSEEEKMVESKHKMLLEIGGKRPRTPFLVATFFGYHNLVKKMLETHRVNIEQVDQHGYTALGLALGLGRPFDEKMVHTLLNAGVSIDQYQTPTAKQLFNDCSDAVAKHKMKLTPLFLACFIGDLQLVQFLTKQEADVNAFHLFPNPSHTIQGAKLEEKAFHVSTPFQIAVSCGHEKIIRYLLQTDRVTQKTVDQCLRFFSEEIENRATRNFLLQYIVQENKEKLISDKYAKEREAFCALYRK